MMWRWWKSRRSRERRERSNCERCCSGRATSGGHGCTADHNHRRNGPFRTMTTRRRPKQRVKNQRVSVTHKKPTSPLMRGRIRKTHQRSCQYSFSSLLFIRLSFRTHFAYRFFQSRKTKSNLTFTPLEGRSVYSICNLLC